MLSRRVKDDDEEDLRIVVRRDEDREEITPDPSPPKKRKLEDDDAELLEMRRKALESLMKRTDKELLKTKDTGERKVVEDVSSEDDSDDSDSDTSLSDPDTSKDGKEPTFIVTMDGIDDYYFKNGAKPAEDKPKTLARRKAESLADSKASSDAELELHADVSFDDVPQKEKPKKKKKKKETTNGGAMEKPTMKVAARKRSPILPPTNGDSSQPVAEVKPLQTAAASKQTSKAVSAAKLAASYAAKLSEIKAAKAQAAKIKSSSENKPSETIDDTKEAPKPVDKEPNVVKKTVPITAPKATPVTAPKPSTELKNKITKPVPKAPENKPITATKRKPITAPSPDRTSAMTGVSKLSYPGVGGGRGQVAPNGSACKFWPRCNRGESCLFCFPPEQTKPKPTSYFPPAAAANASKYKWKAGNKIEY